MMMIVMVIMILASEIYQNVPEWYGWYIRLSGVMCTFVDGQISSDALMQNQQRYCNWIGSNWDEIDLVMI